MSTKRKLPAKLAAPVIKQTPKAGVQSRIDDSKASVATADTLPKPIETETIEISSDSSEGESEGESEEQSDDDAELHSNPEEEPEFSSPSSPPISRLKAAQNGAISHLESDAPNVDDDNEGSDAEPTLGDLVRGAHGGEGSGAGTSTSTTIDVAAMLAADSAAAVASSASRKRRADGSWAAAPGSDDDVSGGAVVAAAPHHKGAALSFPLTTGSLGTVLSQALRTDDTALLEQCLGTADVPTIRATVERLDPSLAGVLLSRMAARLSRRPGRAGALLVWVQWTLVAHGGALLQQGGSGAGKTAAVGGTGTALVARLEELNKVLAERAKGLSSLLALKGKLDLLHSQMQLRELATGRRRGGRGGKDDEDGDARYPGEEGIVYVEGEEREGRADVDMTNGLTPTRRKGKRAQAAEEDSDEEEDVDFPITNGITSETDSDEEDDEDEDDDEEEEAGSGEDDESLDDEDDEDDNEDVDESMGEDDEDSDLEAAAPPPKVQRVTGAFSKRR